MDDEPKRGAKKKRRLVLGSDVDDKMRDLYEKYVCCDLNVSLIVVLFF